LNISPLPFGPLSEFSKGTFITWTEGTLLSWTNMENFLACYLVGILFNCGSI
jgi:hypothetical protein